MANKRESDYPEEREDWLMTVDFALKKSRYGCLLCDKSHLITKCPNRITYAEALAKMRGKNKKEEKQEEEHYINPHNYGW